jgi:hypothetical protein
VISKSHVLVDNRLRQADLRLVCLKVRLEACDVEPGSAPNAGTISDAIRKLLGNCWLMTEIVAKISDRCLQNDEVAYSCGSNGHLGRIVRGECGADV